MDNNNHYCIFKKILLCCLLFYCLTESAHAENLTNNTGRDFISYWSSARLLANGENPYSAELNTTLQQSVGEKEINFCYSPPWLLLFILPFSIGNFLFSKYLWSFIMLSVAFICPFLLWTIYSGEERNRFWSFIILITFYPSFIVLKTGQIVPIILLGVLGFLYFVEKRRWWIASFFTVLLTLKPHILYLFWIALLFWIIQNNNWKFALKILILNLSVLLMPLILDPNIYSQYFVAISAQSFAYRWATPTIGTFLRLMLGGEKHWLQIIPVAAGILWFLFYWFKERKQWEWKEATPWILFVSLITTFYAWYCDYFLIFLTLIQAAVWLTHKYISFQFKTAVFIIFFIFNLLAAIQSNYISSCFFIWFPVIFFFIYYSVRKLAVN